MFEAHQRQRPKGGYAEKEDGPFYDWNTKLKLVRTSPVNWLGSASGNALKSDEFIAPCTAEAFIVFGHLTAVMVARLLCCGIPELGQALVILHALPRILHRGNHWGRQGVIQQLHASKLTAIELSMRWTY